MFSHDTDTGKAVCLADYGRVHRGAIVPQANELYEDVTDWLGEGNELLPFTGYPDTRSLAEAKTHKQQEINAAYQARMEATLSSYPEAETLTFDKQDREAREYQAWVDAGEQGEAPVTPLISNLAAARQMSKGEMATRIVANSDVWVVESGQATGKRQYLEDQVTAATTIAGVEAVNW